MTPCPICQKDSVECEHNFEDMVGALHNRARTALATACLQGILAGVDITDDSDEIEEHCEIAYLYADEMIKQGGGK